MKSDEILMQAYLDGDAQAFRELYGRYSQAIYRFLRKRLTREEDAADVLQAVFLKFHRIRDRYQSKYSVLQWLYVVARSELVDFQRKNQSLAQLEKNWLEMSQTHSSASLNWVDWKDLLEALPEESRKIFVERALGDDDFEAIASRLGKEADAVRQVFRRTRLKLQETLKGEGHG
jgi:RNA polymerase sigma-70 factor (ECF subfamily)